MSNRWTFWLVFVLTAVLINGCEEEPPLSPPTAPEPTTARISVLDIEPDSLVLLPDSVGDFDVVTDKPKQPVRWSSHDPSIATVGEKTGTVTAISPGRTEVEAKAGPERDRAPVIVEEPETQEDTTETNDPPTASASASEDSVAAGDTILFDGFGSSDPDGSIASYDWGFGDGGAATGDTTRHTYDSDGTYTVTLTVTDDDGATDQDTLSILVATPNAPPVADIALSADSLAVGDTLVGDGTGSSDSDGSIVGYDWQMGDGTAYNDPIVEHVYSDSGTYEVVLAVTDDDGATDGESALVTVSDVEEPVEEDTTTEPTPTGDPVFHDGFESGDLSHSENGYEWVGTSGRVSVSTERALEGANSLKISHPAKPPNEDSFEYAELLFGESLKEVWVEYAIWIPANYTHRVSSEGSHNNKFFQLWGGNRSGSDKLYFNVEANAGPSASVAPDSEFRMIRITESGGVQPIYRVDGVAEITDAHKGRWVTLRAHLKVASCVSGAVQEDGAVEVWWDGEKLLELLSEPFANCGTRVNVLGRIRLLGWSNSGYDEVTDFYFDAIKVFDTDPGW